MAPKAKVSASGDIGHGISFEVRPQKKGSPTVHVDVAGNRLPAFRLKDGKSVEEQVSTLQQVLERRHEEATVSRFSNPSLEE